MTRLEMALASANEVIGWVREDRAEGKAARGAKRLASAISDAESELSSAKDADTRKAVEAGLALLRAEVQS